MPYLSLDTQRIASTHTMCKGDAHEEIASHFCLQTNIDLCEIKIMVQFGMTTGKDLQN